MAGEIALMLPKQDAAKAEAPAGWPYFVEPLEGSFDLFTLGDFSGLGN
jgi:hypothetical protein